MAKVQQEMITVRTRLATLTSPAGTTTGTAITASTGNVISNDLFTVKISSNVS